MFTESILGWSVVGPLALGKVFNDIQGDPADPHGAAQPDGRLRRARQGRVHYLAGSAVFCLLDDYLSRRDEYGNFV